MKNNKVYDKSHDQHLSLTILNNRWRLFGHVLSLSEDLPAYKSTMHYFSESSKSKFKGRQRITLPITIDADIQRAIRLKTISNYFNILSFKSTNDLRRLTEIALNRSEWKLLSRQIFFAAQAEKF